jgi:hypothetical protein
MFDEDIMPIETLFRSFAGMPELEQKALKLAQGRTLDVGAGAGCHSLILQEKGIDVTAIDISPLSVETMRERGVMKVLQQDFFTLNTQFDTILLLMNGIGIVGKAENPNIEACSEWTRISVPFTYTDNGLEPKAIMLTFSTCATPGGGKGDEVLLVDDVELIYKSSVTPDNPDNPDTPVTPDNPDNPDTPDTPDTPEESGVSYTDDLVVTVANVDGTEESTTIPASTINISQNSDGSYKLSIKNFALGPGMVLGDVVADNLTGTTDGEYTTIKMSGVPVKLSNELFAAALGDLKINLDAKFTADKLYALIDLDVTALNQVVNVIFGSPFTETGIDHVTVKKHSGVDQVYEIGGQHVNRASVPGLYIINGKKVIKK